MEKWRKLLLNEQTTANLKYNLAIGKMSKETEKYIISILKKRGIK